MKRFMNWLTNSFTPTMNKFSQKPVVAALSSSMQKIIPFILTGSCIHLYNVLRSTIPALPNFIRIINFSFGMLGLLTAFMVANQMMEKLGHTKYTINAGLTAISVFIMFIKPVIDANGMFSVEFNRFVLLIFLMTFFYTLGISHWLWNGVKMPIFMAGIAANIAAVEAGLAPMNIATNEAVFTAGLITMGGMGATLTLNLLMCFSKSKSLKTVGRLTILPSIFNINEPIMYSAPIVMNPLLMVPMWINSITGPLVVWFTMRSGLLNIPSKMIQVGQIPAPLSSVMITEDLRAILVYVVLFLIYLATWYPFFKVYEKQRIAEEQSEALNG